MKKNYLFTLTLCLMAFWSFSQQKQQTPQTLQPQQTNNTSCLTEVTPEQAAMEMARDREAYQDQLQSLINNGPETTREYVIQLHLLRNDNGTNGNPVPTIAQIRSEIANYVNPYFNTATLNATFVECGPEMYHHSTTYNSLNGLPEGYLMSQAYNVDSVINIYFVEDAYGACGWARFPANLPEDYIVIAYSCATNQSTLVHELGHYFDLYHTHETYFGNENVTRNTTNSCYNAATTGDLLADTEADPRLNNGVSISQSTCTITNIPYGDYCYNTPYTPDPTNIMSYSLKTCRTVFSPGQEARMAAAMNSSRSYLKSTGCPSLCGVSAVTAGTQSPCTNSLYSQDITVTYTSAPATGTLNVHGQSFPITTSPQTITLTNLVADGLPVNVTASFSAEPRCSLAVSNTFTAPAACPPPANDLCADAIAISCGATVSGTTTNATFDSVGDCGTSNTAPGVWYTFTATTNAVNLSTCNQANFDTKISVFSGSCSALACEGGQDDNNAICSGFTTDLNITTVPGTTYFVLVHGFGQATGDFDLTLTCIPPPANDSCAYAIPVACGSTTSGSTISATVDAVAACGTGYNGGLNTATSPGVWYSFVASTNQTRLYTCNQANFDTKISVFSGTCGALVCEDGQDDFVDCSGYTTDLTMATTPGTTYYVLVHGFGSTSGDFDLTIECLCTASATFQLYGLNKLWANAGANNPNIFYHGVTQGKNIRVNATGGVGPYTYVWSNSEGYTMKNQSGNQIQLFEPQSSSWVICEITDQGTGCITKDSVFVELSDEFYCGTPANQWQLKMCAGGTSICMPWNQAKAALKAGTATLGDCPPLVPKTGANPNFAFTVYPNPAQEFIKVSNLFTYSSSGTVEVLDINGKLMYSQSIDVNPGFVEITMPLNNFANGMYMVRLRTDREVLVERFQQVK